MVACRPMQTEPEINAPSVVAISWAAAIAAFPLALVVAVFGQGVGAMVGGCHWIGVSLPLDREVWALVNQPVLNFASLPTAGGYWLGSLVVPLMVAALVIPLLPRAQSLIVEISVVQVAWGAAAVAVAWLPLLDEGDGHLTRWLALNGLSTSWVWLAPAFAAAAGLLPTLRLLELARRRHKDTGRIYRVALVVIHLVVPVVLWVGLASLIRSSVPLEATLAIAVPVCAALLLAWLRYPAPYVRPLERPSVSGVISLVICSALATILIWTTGRPLPDDESAGILWGTPQAYNNIRPWIDPVSIWD
jgi:hypothetical protein